MSIIKADVLTGASINKLPLILALPVNGNGKMSKVKELLSAASNVSTLWSPNFSTLPVMIKASLPVDRVISDQLPVMFGTILGNCLLLKLKFELHLTFKNHCYYLESFHNKYC